ncbi:hypothetical protein P3J6_110350 [Pseudoalteromonas sp. 3J6]|nr:hypothetical protein P3J6_110350 [Pseudoalteromonas sp. 3J6]
MLSVTSIFNFKIACIQLLWLISLSNLKKRLFQSKQSILFNFSMALLY